MGKSTTAKSEIRDYGSTFRRAKTIDNFPIVDVNVYLSKPIDNPFRAQNKVKPHAELQTEFVQCIGPVRESVPAVGVPMGIEIYEPRLEQ